MTPGQVFSVQLADTAREVERLARSLDPDRAPPRSAPIVRRLSPEIRRRLAVAQTRLEALGARAGQPSALPGCWVDLNDFRKDNDEFLKQCRDLTLGVAIRAAGLDDRLCQIADALLVELGVRADRPWTRASILGSEHHYSDLGETVRVRALASSVWELPIVAHEFGHFLRLQLFEWDASRNLLDAYYGNLCEDAKVWEKQDRRVTWPRVEEAFADISAVYALGPTFARAAIVGTFNPCSATDWPPRHPSADFRAKIICAALSQLGSDCPFQGTADDLLATWNAECAQAMPDGATFVPELDDVARSVANNVLEKLATLPPELAYKRSSGFESLVNALCRDDLTEPKTKANVSQILDAAWTARIKAPEKADVIADRTLEILRSVSAPGEMP